MDQLPACIACARRSAASICWAASAGTEERTQRAFLHHDVRSTNDRKDPLTVGQASCQIRDYCPIPVFAAGSGNAIQECLGWHRVEPPQGRLTIAFHVGKLLGKR